jgi:Zn-dependent protease
MLKMEYRIGRVWGIPIKIHISLFALVAFLVSQGGIEGAKAGGVLAGAIGMLFMLLLAILVFSSIALHELGHSFVALRKGCRVHEITLMFIGGAAKMEQMPSKPKDECLMAIAGPAVSLVLGGIGIAASISLNNTTGLWKFLEWILFQTGRLNLVLAVFNLIPAFPMDGGRVFRALMTPKHGRLKATYLASRLGRTLAIVFFIVGIFGVEAIPFLRGGTPTLVIIAIFIFITADKEYRMVQFEELMKQRGFGSAWPGMQPPPPPQEMDVDDETVLISPPPYAKGPAAKTELHHAEESDNPIKRFFGR